MANNLKTLLETVLSNNNSCEIQLIANWNKIVGQLKGHVSLEKIQKNGTIILGVESSSWMQELNMFSNVLIKKINQHIDKPIAKKIRFKLITKSKFKKLNLKLKSKIESQKKIDIKMNIRQERALEKIKDPDLTMQLKNYLQKCQSY